MILSILTSILLVNALRIVSPILLENKLRRIPISKN